MCRYAAIMPAIILSIIVMNRNQELCWHFEVILTARKSVDITDRGTLIEQSVVLIKQSLRHYNLIIAVTQK